MLYLVSKVFHYPPSRTLTLTSFPSSAHSQPFLSVLSFIFPIISLHFSFPTPSNFLTVLHNLSPTFFPFLSSSLNTLHLFLNLSSPFSLSIYPLRAFHPCCMSDYPSLPVCVPVCLHQSSCLLLLCPCICVSMNMRVRLYLSVSAFQDFSKPATHTIKADRCFDKQTDRSIVIHI